LLEGPWRLFLGLVFVWACLAIYVYLFKKFCGRILREYVTRKVFCSFFMNMCMGDEENKGKEAEAGQGLGEDLDARLKELEKYLKGEFYERIKDFWYEALKYYAGNVLDISELEKEFGKIRNAPVGGPFFYTELRYKYHLYGIIDEFAKRVREKPGTYPESISYCRVFTMRFYNGICIDFYDAVVLEVGDSLRKKASVIVLDFREARVRRCGDP